MEHVNALCCAIMVLVSSESVCGIGLYMHYVRWGYGCMDLQAFIGLHTDLSSALPLN